ncbi:MAG: TRAFs-binding domain-containing protein [Pseudomonadota bacterium]
MSKPLCFVLMPFGVKTDENGRQIDFDHVYENLIRPAIVAAELEPVRADEEKVGGLIHKPMFERLVICEYAIADLTTANANVFYELGVRHATRPWTTIVVFASETRLPFDVAPLRGLPYRMNSDSGMNADDVSALTKLLVDSRVKTKDSPVFQLIDGLHPQEVDHEKTDVFRDRVKYSQSIKMKLREARESDLEGVRAVEQELGPLVDVELGVLVDLLLSYRAKSGWKEMIALVEAMSEPFRRQVMIQEQYGFALNRDGRHADAEQTLKCVLERHGPSSETYGILGRVYKDQWQTAQAQGDQTMASAFLNKAIDAYKRGFETDWRDAYPGINAVTLMELSDPPDPEKDRLLPVVQYSVDRRTDGENADYWDYATQLELAVLAKDEGRARQYLTKMVPEIGSEGWMPETTAKNLGLIREARLRRGETMVWADEIEQDLLGRA